MTVFHQSTLILQQVIIHETLFHFVSNKWFDVEVEVGFIFEKEEKVDFMARISMIVVVFVLQGELMPVE